MGIGVRPQPRTVNSTYFGKISTSVPAPIHASGDGAADKGDRLAAGHERQESARRSHSTYFSRTTISANRFQVRQFGFVC